jgi:short-subunit dehydrogenase
MIEKTLAHFGNIDILICNAGISMHALFAKLETEVFHRIMNVNFWGTVYCTKYALPALFKSKGSVVAVSSDAGFAPLPGRTAYCASKYAIHGFLNTLRTENFKKGLHVLISAPGFTATEIRTHSLTADGSRQKESPRDEGKMVSSDYVAEKIYNAILKRKRSLVLGFEGKISIFIRRICPALHDKIVFNFMAKEKNSAITKD